MGIGIGYIGYGIGIKLVAWELWFAFTFRLVRGLVS